MLSRISTSRIAPTALRRIVPYRVFSRLGHPVPRSRILLQTHQASYQIGIETFSTTRPWFKKQRKGDILGRLISAADLEKEMESAEEMYYRNGIGGYIPLAKVLSVILAVIIVLLPIGVGLTCVRWILRKVGVLQDPQVAKGAKNHGDMDDDDQYGKK